jgi:tetratricopeptide (TPR) repeat protein
MAAPFWPPRRSRWLAVAALALAAAPTGGQIPQTFTNLQVLPKEVSRGELVGIMRGWASALGVRCTHCHVGPDDLQGMDFATDERPTKRAAREMQRMVQTINAGALQALPPSERPRQTVSCMTCHRGAPLPPLPIDEELVQVARSRGAAAAVERYRELRREHGEDGQYDFRPHGLGGAVVRLSEAGQTEEALALARLAAEQHPEVARVHLLLGGILQRRGERAAAVDALRRALALDPQLADAQRALQELTAAAPTP